MLLRRWLTNESGVPAREYLSRAAIAAAAAIVESVDKVDARFEFISVSYMEKHTDGAGDGERRGGMEIRDMRFSSLDLVESGVGGATMSKVDCP